MTTDKVTLNESEVAVELGESLQEYLLGNEESFRAKVSELHNAGVPTYMIAQALKKYYSFSISKGALQGMVVAA